MMINGKTQLTDHYIPLQAGETIRILFLFQAASAWPSWESFYRACSDDERIDISVMLLTETAVESAQMLTAREFLETQKISYQPFSLPAVIQFNPHAAVVQFPYDVSYHTPDALSIQLKNRGIRIVYIPYGIEIADTAIARKDHFQTFVVENSWRIYTCCEEISKEYQKYCRNRQAVRVLGSPKFDGLAQREKYPLSSVIAVRKGGRRLIVWKLHFPKKMTRDGNVVQITPDLQEYLEFASSIETYTDCLFVILPHPKLLHGMVASDVKGDSSLKKDIQKLIRMLIKKRNVYLDETDDYRNTFYHADAIMMDRSALLVEAAMTGAPVLFLTNQEEKEIWTNGVKQVIDTLYEGTSAQDMAAFLKMVRQKKDPGRQDRVSTVDHYFPYHDGLCGFRIKEDVIAGLNRKQPDRLRLILYGIGEVCEYYLKRCRWEDNTVFNIVGMTDSDSRKWGGSFRKWVVSPPTELKDMDFDGIVIMTEQHYFEIKKYLVYDLRLDERRIWRLDEFIWEMREQL